MTSLPSFLCIGSQKAGTTWLDKQLRTHPEIWLPPMKEVHYFDFVHRPEFRKWISWHLRATTRRELNKLIEKPGQLNWKDVNYLSNIMTKEKFTDSWYEYIFSAAEAGKVTGEITPEYSTLNKSAIKHIEKLCHEPKYIYIIRDPVKRTWSQLKMNMVRNGDYSKAVKNNKVVDIDLFYNNIRHESILDRGNYSKYVPNWDQFTDRVKYIPFGDIKERPKDLLKEVCGFINVSTEVDFSSASTQVHKGSGMKIPQSVHDMLSEVLEEQTTFITERFGKDFYSKI
jgi:hypothetical protein